MGWYCSLFWQVGIDECERYDIWCSLNSWHQNRLGVIMNLCIHCSGCCLVLASLRWQAHIVVTRFSLGQIPDRMFMHFKWILEKFPRAWRHFHVTDQWVFQYFYSTTRPPYITDLLSLGLFGTGAARICARSSCLQWERVVTGVEPSFLPMWVQRSITELSTIMAHQVPPKKWYLSVDWPRNSQVFHSVL